MRYSLEEILRKGWVPSHIKKVKHLTQFEKEIIITYWETHKVCPHCEIIFEVVKSERKNVFHCGSLECTLKQDKIKEEQIQKTKQTKLKRYGAENYANTEKQRQTMLKKYGVTHPSQLPKKERKTFTLKGKEFKFLSPDIPPGEITQEHLKMRQHGVEPWMLKKGFTKTSYKEYCKIHKVCFCCSKILNISKEKYFNIATQFFCNSSVCEEQYRKSLNASSGKTKAAYENKTQEEKQEIYNKHKETLKVKYGVEYIGQIESGKVKSKKTRLERYGDANYNNKEKARETLIKNYGSIENAYKIQVAKSKQSKFEKYGDENYNNMEKIKDTSFKRHGKIGYNNRELCKANNNAKYGSDWYVNVEKRMDTIAQKIEENPNYWKEHRAKITKSWVEKIGRESPEQKHIKNYDYYNDEEVWKKFTSIKEAAEYFNVCGTTATNKLKKFNPKILKARSLTQNLIFSSINVKDKVENTRNIIPPKELDIYIPSAKLAIEYDGLLFHSQGVSKHSMLNTPDFDKNYHLQKTLECNSQGIQLFHIFEGENIDLWLSMINNKLGLNSRIYARNCYAEELRNSDVKDFLNENHLQGFCNASIAIGLYLQDSKNTSKEEILNTRKLVAAMTFSKPRFSKGYDYELVRFCSLKGFNIIGGASKLWKFFLKKYSPKSVISYANLRFSSGKLYENLGFSLKHRSEPNYYYFKDDMVLHSRNKFQKHKLKDLLEIYDADKSEVENMFANGYRRIFDCGNLVYEWFAKI